MTVDYIRTLFAYNKWANHRILANIETADREKVTRDLGSSYSSIRDTLVHIVGSEWVWLSRWKGDSPTGFPNAAGLVDVPSIRTRWLSVERELDSFLKHVTDERLLADLSYNDTRGRQFSQPLGEQMCHVVNHSTYHRGQITTMLRQVNETPVSTDMIVYLRTL